MMVCVITRCIYTILAVGCVCYGHKTWTCNDKHRCASAKYVPKGNGRESSCIRSSDCSEIYRNGTRTDGVYSISPDGRCPFFVYCDMSNGGWTLIQNRVDRKVNFYRSWDDYVSGFGDVDGSHWLGLEKIHRLTRDGSQIYFDMENYDGTTEYAHYKVFTVHGATTTYTMNVDAFNYEGSIDELLSFHNNMKFSTYDRDNDISSENCCVKYLDGGGWWNKNCYRLGNMNGVFSKTQQGGIGYWTTKNVPIKKVTIKVKAMNVQC